MKKANFKGALKSAQKVVGNHSPEILTVIGVGSFLGSIVLAVKETPKAHELIEEEIRYRNQVAEEEAIAAGQDTCPNITKLKPLDIAKVTWKCYLPVAASAIFGTACIIGANSVNSRRNAALATAYKLSETALSEYKDKVIETIGDKKEKNIKEAIAQDRLDKNPVTANNVIITGAGTTLCYDSVSSTYFESDIESIRKAINNLNARLLSEDYVSLNEFHDELDLEHSSIGDDIGWNIGRDGLIDVDFSSKIAKDGRPCIVLDYSVAPRYDYSKMI